MCKTYDAIYELSQHAESDILICCVGDSKVEGRLYKCEKKDGKCFDEVITLQDAIITCKRSGETKEFRWFNVPSRHIQAFAFKCCEK